MKLYFAKRWWAIWNALAHLSKFSPLKTVWEKLFKVFLKVSLKRSDKHDARQPWVVPWCQHSAGAFRAWLGLGTIEQHPFRVMPVTWQVLPHKICWRIRMLLGREPETWVLQLVRLWFNGAGSSSAIASEAQTSCDIAFSAMVQRGKV